MQPTKSFKSFKKFFYIFAGLVIIIVLGYKIFTSVKKTNTQATNPKAITSQAEQKVSLNKEFEFKIPAINDQGQMIVRKEGQIKFVLTDAELKKEIKVKNETKKANDGQNYLILRIELQNDTADRLAIISNKYIRLIGENNKKFSPDFHNAMVAIDPLSVRRDLVAYIVNQNAKNFTFQIGELEGQKQSIEMAF